MCFCLFSLAVCTTTERDAGQFYGRIGIGNKRLLFIYITIQAYGVCFFARSHFCVCVCALAVCDTMNRESEFWCRFVRFHFVVLLLRVWAKSEFWWCFPLYKSFIWTSIISFNFASRISKHISQVHLNPIGNGLRLIDKIHTPQATKEKWKWREKKREKNIRKQIFCCYYRITTNQITM